MNLGTSDLFKEAVEFANLNLNSDEETTNPTIKKLQGAISTNMYHGYDFDQWTEEATMILDEESLVAFTDAVSIYKQYAKLRRQAYPWDV